MANLTVTDELVAQRDVFGNTLIELIDQDPRTYVLDGDLANSTKADLVYRLEELCPVKQFTCLSYTLNELVYRVRVFPHKSTNFRGKFGVSLPTLKYSHINSTDLPFTHSSKRLRVRIV